MPNVKREIQQWIKENHALASTIGDISLGKQIGEGGTALVFESDFMNGTAIKFLAESVQPRPSTRYQRFLSEYVNLVKLVPSGSVVPLYHFGIQDMGDVRIPYIVMELCEATLHEHYQADMPDEEEFEDLLNRLLTILETIHSIGIIHRDFKPKNILRRRNGDWVLADFGISWFDPQHYMRLAETGRGDRLANWQFSPPEQFRRDGYEQATPCLDLYALGQTLYHCVTEDTIRGSDYPPLQEYNPALASFDPLIHRLVRQRPEERFQSVAEVRDFLEEQKEPEDFYFRLALRKAREVDNFDESLARAMPGSSARPYTQASKEGMERVLSVLAEDYKKCNLWWTRGRGDSPISRLEPWTDDIWLLNSHECKIVDLWIYRHPTPERQYVIIHLAARPAFEVYDTRRPETMYEEAGYFQSQYITIAEYWDGYTLRDGESVRIVDAERRVRNLKDDFFILAPVTSVYIQDDVGYDQIHPVRENLREAGKINPAILQPLETIRRPLWMMLFD
jgi:serine/threonine-protein kinase